MDAEADPCRWESHVGLWIYFNGAIKGCIKGMSRIKDAKRHTPAQGVDLSPRTGRGLFSKMETQRERCVRAAAISGAQSRPSSLWDQILLASPLQSSITLWPWHLILIWLDSKVPNCFIYKTPLKPALGNELKPGGNDKHVFSVNKWAINEARTSDGLNA